MLGKICNSLIVSAFLVLIPVLSVAQTLNIEALKEIEKFAESFCGQYLTEGESEALKISGEAKAELDGLIGRLVDLGVKGAADLDSKRYVGVLQEDVRGALQDARKCKLALWNDLKEAVVNLSQHTPATDSPHAPRIEINQRYIVWEENTMQFRLEPGKTKVLKGMDLYASVATYPKSSCAGPGFVPYTWQVRLPYPSGGDLEIRSVLMGGKTEQVGLGSMGRGTLGYCGEHTFKNNGVEEIQVEVRYTSAADPN